MTEKFDPEFDAIRAALVSRPELTKDLNVSLRNVLRLTEHLQNRGLRMERHGRWIDEVDLRPELYGWVPLNSVVCSGCDLSNSVATNYCPSCGAKMDGGKANDQN